MPIFTPEVMQRAVQQAIQQQPPSAQQSNSFQNPPSNSDIGIAPYLASIGGQAADSGSTLYKINHGYSEGNPIFGGSIPALIGTKLAMGVGMPLAMKYLASHGHPTAAKTLGYVSGLEGAIPAAINLSRPNLK